VGRVRRFLDRWLRISRLDFPVPPHGKQLLYSLGGITFIGFLILFLSGIWLTQLFNPAPQRAYESVRFIMREAWGGAFVRSLHYWTAQAVIALLAFHLLRVFATGAYKFPRTATWLFGVFLFFLTVMGFYLTGTVLKWDQEGYEALLHYDETIKHLGPLQGILSEGLAKTVGLNVRFYAAHINTFPLLFAVLITAHFYLVHVFNLAPPWRGPSSRLPELPDRELTGRFSEHLRSIALYSLIYYGAVVILALLFPAPLGPQNSGRETGVKPPWPYLWMYGLENLIGAPGIFYGALFLFIIMILVPWLDRGEDRDPSTRKGMLIGGALVLLVLVALSLYAWLGPEVVHFHAHGVHDH
jgi:quinol-cytochrome oxidoreductase complex cytochrome b subunit